jgi:pimeloyl-ACP methyl ester carboxylesterase
MTDMTPLDLAGRRDRDDGRPWDGLRSTDAEVITDDGVPLAVRDYCPPAPRHTVVFLHGLCLDRRTWSHQIGYLRRRYAETVRVISYDHRGHGRSGPAPMRTYCPERLAEDLAQVIYARNVTGNVTLAGHSLGGMTALAYCGLTAGDRPVEPQGLVLAATAAGRLTERGLGRLLATPAPGLLFGLVDHAPEHVLRALTGPLAATFRRWGGAGPVASATLAMVAAALANVSAQTTVGFLPSLRSYDQHRTLTGIQARTVVISGGADLLTPACHADELAASIPHAEHLHLPRAGHMLPQEAPHVLNNALRRVIGARDRSWCRVSA